MRGCRLSAGVRWHLRPLEWKSWRCLCVVGPLDLSMVGVLSALAEVLAQAGVAIFVVSTYDTDDLLVRTVDLRQAVQALQAAGHLVRS